MSNALPSLLAWYDREREPYFFRKNRNAYRVWVVEVALQQTRIKAALKPLEYFFKCFPTLEDLARAKEEKVLQAFRGLGYYARAKNLLKGARHICKLGDFPRKQVDLLKVPSIGPYTAAAIASICYGDPIPVVDGNIKRILARFYKWNYQLSDAKLAKESYRVLAAVFVNLAYHPGDVNEAFMELGQKICTKSSPSCESCPLAIWCCAFCDDCVGNFPAISAKQEKIQVIWHLYFLENNSKKILMQRWKGFYFLKGHLAFPCVLEFPKTRECTPSWQSNHKFNSRLAATALGTDLHKLPSIKHTITKHDIKIHSYAGQSQKAPTGTRWVAANRVGALLVSSALSKAWNGYLAAKKIR